MTVPGSTARVWLGEAASEGSARALRGGAMAACAALCVVCGGCELFSDLDRFEQEDEPRGGNGGRGGPDAGQQDAGPDDAGPSDDLGCSNPRTLCLRLELFSPHVDELVSVDLVTVADNILRARAIIEPMGGVNADFVLPLAIPASEVPEPGEDHPLQLEIFADQDKSGGFTPGSGDHTWNLELPPDGKVVFVHNTEFTSIEPRPQDIGVDFRMQFFDMMPHVDQLLEVMVIERASGRTVGLYRTTSIPSADFEVTIPGIIDPDGTVYRLEFYADLNGNGTYDDPDADHTWEINFIESGADGVDAMFTHGTNFADLRYQFDFEP
jgi:hypothetical protein